MHAFPGTWTALCALALLLGARHGLDADHLATIDGLCRYNARANPRLTRLCGTLFSLGHGVIVVLVAIAAGTLSHDWSTPHWLEGFGVTVSAVILISLAAVNVRAAMCATSGEPAAPTGWRWQMVSRMLGFRQGWSVVAIGALFALSFDTLSQAAVFAIAASRFGGTLQVLFVALLFAFGMILVDGANGFWIGSLVRRADRIAVVASRVMTLGVAASSITAALFVSAKFLGSSFDGWISEHELECGLSIVVIVALAFVISLGVARYAGARSSKGASAIRQQ